jgi:tetratricopeptide (TPR) repeat protein
MFEEAGDRVGAAWESSHEGDVALQQGDATAAGALYEQALTAFREQGEPFGAANALADLGDVAQASGILDEAAGLYRQALSAYLRLGHRRAARRALEGLAIVAAGSGRLEDSLLLAAAAATERARTGSRTHEHLKEALAAAITRAREELDPETAAATWRRGFRMSFEQAVQLAAGPEPQAEA